MTAKTPREILDDNLRRAHAYAQAIEEAFRKAIEATTQEGREAEAANLDFEAFLEKWTAMLPAVHDLADAAGVDPSVFASSFADLLITIRARVASNEELRKTMQTSISDKIANARLIEWNPEWLEEPAPAKLADKITMAPDPTMIYDTVAELDSRGDPATERLWWLAEALKKNGYVI